MSTPIADTIKDYLADYFSIPVSAIKNATTVDDIENWDSLATAEIILELEEKLDIELDEEDLLEMVDVGCIIEVFEKRKADQ